MNWKCWFFHDWSEWKTFARPNARSQDRQCRRCGKLVERVIVWLRPKPELPTWAQLPIEETGGKDGG